MEIPSWQVRIGYKGRREWINLHTANKSEAAIMAHDAYLMLCAEGWEKTLAKFKPAGDRNPERNPMIEQFAELYRDRLRCLESPPSFRTAERYLSSLNFICRKIRVRYIADLIPEKIDRFADDFIDAATKEGPAPNSARISCNAHLRNAAALFSSRMLDNHLCCWLARKTGERVHFIKGICEQVSTG